MYELRQLLLYVQNGGTWLPFPAKGNYLSSSDIKHHAGVNFMLRLDAPGTTGHGLLRVLSSRLASSRRPATMAQLGRAQYQWLR